MTWNTPAWRQKLRHLKWKLEHEYPYVTKAVHQATCKAIASREAARYKCEYEAEKAKIDQELSELRSKVDELCRRGIQFRSEENRDGYYHLVIKIDPRVTNYGRASYDSLHMLAEHAGRMLTHELVRCKFVSPPEERPRYIMTRLPDA